MTDRLHDACGLPFADHVWRWSSKTRKTVRLCPDDPDVHDPYLNPDPLRARPSGGPFEPDAEDTRWEREA